VVMEKPQRPFCFLDHTADVQFQAFGRTLAEAFRHAAHALLSIMWDRVQVAPAQSIAVRIEGRDKSQLLVGFLEEILFLWDARAFMLGEIENVRIETDKEKGYILTCVFVGEEYHEGLRIEGEVKAITYNEMVIEKRTNGTVMVQVVADI
jgi:SHS2 domain-containing protein